MYKVGGYVRDKILGIKSKDIDYVVVGADINHMLQLGLVPVGRHFPVFINSKTGTQYALARTERKTGFGYHGFEFYAAPDVTLEQDLKRRDLTINAIAEDENGQLIDPFNGISDLKNKIIRHTSAAFIEDPLRVLRVARFRAKLGFDIAPETIMLMRKISNSGELEHLSTERIWDEVRKSLDCNNPLEFFVVLSLVDALEHILCEFKIILENRELFAKLHEDLITAIKLNYSPEEKFAIIISELELYKLNITNKIISDCKLGRNYTELASIIGKTHPLLLKLNLKNTQEILQLVNQLSPLKRHERFEQITKTLTVTAIGNELLNLKFLEKIAYNFGQIDYENIKKTKPNNYIDTINQKKLSIISETTQQFFGTQP